MRQIVVVAEQEDLASAINRGLPRDRGFSVLTASDRDIRSNTKILPKPHLLIVPLQFVTSPAPQLFEKLARLHPQASVIAILRRSHPLSGGGVPPFGVDDILVCAEDEELSDATVDALVQKIITLDRLQALQEKLRVEMGESQIIAKSRPMREIMQHLPSMASSMSTVLITGETGTGKELIARAIHYLGPRAGQPFITVDCGNIPENLVENELFGHARGAYTGAGHACKGLIQEADGGTLFLDEVEALPLAVQSKFLRFLQERQCKPLGRAKYSAVNVRVLAASNLDLSKAVENKTFRKDLFYRLSVVPLFIPPLRERKADILPLAQHFLRRYAHASQQESAIPNDLVQAWLAHHWPGNARELENKIQEWLTLGPMDKSSGDAPLGDTSQEAIRPLAEVQKEALARCHRTYFQKLLAHTHGNLSAAARCAGIHRKSLGHLLKKCGIDAKRFRS